MSREDRDEATRRLKEPLHYTRLHPDSNVRKIIHCFASGGCICDSLNIQQITVLLKYLCHWCLFYTRNENTKTSYLEDVEKEFIYQYYFEPMQDKPLQSLICACKEICEIASKHSVDPF